MKKCQGYFTLGRYDTFYRIGVSWSGCHHLIFLYKPGNTLFTNVRFAKCHHSCCHGVVVINISLSTSLAIPYKLNLGLPRGTIVIVIEWLPSPNLPLYTSGNTLFSYFRFAMCHPVVAMDVVEWLTSPDLPLQAWQYPIH